jgi:RNA polymerase I-specific transcription initiation factor RRN6
MDLQENFQLLSRHREVLPPTRSAFPEVFLRRKPSEVAGCQKNWLLENHPEAVAGGGLDTRSLGVELKALKGIVARDVGSTTSSLLAVGEITDRTNLRSGTVGQPVIAMAAGEGGHILRIVRLSLDDAVWTEVDLSVRRSKVSTSARADWAEDGVPITLIKFATDGTRSHPTRWLLVQKMTGSTVLEPEVNVMPLQGGISDYKQSHLYYQMQRYISTNRLFTISAQKTGGGAQVDACFNPAADGRFPQLAIIDELGHWTVWDIPISRSAPTEAPRPILTARGVIGPSALPSLRTNLGRDLGTHRLVWVLPKGGRRAEQKDEYEGVEHAHWVPYSRSPVRCSHVLVCSDTDVWLYDVTHGAQLAGIRVVKVNRAESVVDMQSSPVSPSQAFVLTTSSLYWLESKIARDGQAQISVISSYPHYRRAQAEELILSVSPLAGLASPQSCAVFILSGKDKAADLLICTEPAPDGAAHTTQQVVRADIPPSTRAVFIASLPLRRYGEAGPSDAPALDNNDRRVFQMYALKSDLSLLSAMFVTSAKPLHDVVSLHTFNEADRSDTLRKQFLRLMGDAFVVPECFEDRLQTSLSVTERHGDEIGSKVKSSKKRDVIDLKAASGRLEELVIKEITPVKKSRQLLAGVIHHRGVEELGDNENMRIRTL